jgi:hypothetical protein
MSVNTLMQEDLVNSNYVRGLNALIQEGLVFSRRDLIRDLISCFKEQHPCFFSIIKSVLSGHKIMIRLQIMENDIAVEKYTLLMDGIDILAIKSGDFDFTIDYPLVNAVKPYVRIKHRAIETMDEDENFATAIFAAIAKYLPDITVGFMP